MNVAALIAAVENRYWCMAGPPRAYFDIQACSEPLHALRLVYVELAAQVRGRLADNEAFLCDWMDRAFGYPAEAGEWNRGACLFWRLSSKIEVAEQETTVEIIKRFLGYRESDDPTPEELLSHGRYSPDDLGWRSKIYARLVIPGRDLSEWAKLDGGRIRMLVKP